MVLWAIKWSIVLRHTKASFKKILPVSFIGYLMNNITPVSMAGGEPVRAYMLSQVDDISTEDSAASVIVDLFLEVFPLLIMILFGIGFAFFYNIGHGIALLLAVAGLFVLFTLFVIILLFVNEKVSLKMIEYTINFVEKIPVSYLRNHAKEAKTRIDDIITNFMNAMRTTMTDYRILTAGIIISSITQAMWVVRLYIIFKMIGFDLPIAVLIIGRITVAAVSFASIIPGGLAIWEGVGTWIYAILGVPAPSAMAANLIERMFSYWIGSLIGMFAAVSLGVSHIIKKYIS